MDFFITEILSGIGAALFTYTAYYLRTRAKLGKLPGFLKHIGGAQTLSPALERLAKECSPLVFDYVKEAVREAGKTNIKNDDKKSNAIARLQKKVKDTPTLKPLSDSAANLMVELAVQQLKVKK